jgi:hypothetical protein
VSIFAVFDGDPARGSRIATEIPSGSAFSLSLTLSDRNFNTSASHRLDVYAIDETGMISTPVTFVVYVIAPTYSHKDGFSFGAKDSHAVFITF